MSSENPRVKPLRAGLYGAGAFGRFVAASLQGSPTVRVAAVASRTPERAHALGSELGVPAFRSYDDLMCSGLDLIVLCTPPGQHVEQTVAALATGLHVFVEKPFAADEAGVRSVLEAAQTHGRIVAVDYPMLYSPLIEAVALFARSRLAGPLVRISVENLASAQGLGEDHWFWNQDLSGGIFVEHGVHFFDWVGRVAGEAQKVIGLTPSPSSAFAVVRHAGGSLATYFHAFITTPERERTRTVVSFEAVDLVLDGWIPTSLHLRGQGAAVGTTTIRRMMSRTVASIPDPRAGFIFDAGEKLALYAHGVRSAAEDMARAIVEPGYVARNDVRNAVSGLRVALAAREAAGSP